MTGAATSRGRVFHDFDSYKNDEWLRRRKLRIEQVRRQSKEIAKALRQKVENEEKIKTKVFEKIEQARFKCWRAEKLDEMERKLRCALEEFGLGHKLAEAEPCPNELIAVKNKINSWKAQERGDIAKQEEIKKKKQEEIMKQLPIERKKKIRKVENLRSALICSISAHKNLLETRKSNDTLQGRPESVKNTPKKEFRLLNDQATDIVPENSIKTSFLVDEPVKDLPETLKDNDGLIKSPLITQKADTIWIDLNDVQNSSRTSEKKSQSSKITANDQSDQDKIRPVEFYDYYSRYNCKTYREYVNLVEKINCGNEGNLMEQIKDDKLLEEVENKKKIKAHLATKERGQEALRKEKLKRDYNKMLVKLEDLNKKEKLIKAHQPTASAVVYMTDERLLEKAKMRQRIMNTKFENIYFNATNEVPPCRPSSNLDLEHHNAIVSKSPEAGDSVKLSFSPAYLKNNSPVFLTESKSTSSGQNRLVRSIVPIKKKKRKLKKKLLLDIDRALKEGRKLRETLLYNWIECGDTREGDCIVESESGSEERLKISCKNDVDGPKRIKDVLDQEAQTDDLPILHELLLNNDGSDVKKVDFSGQAGHETTLSNISSSTSYRSPPSEINCSTFRPLFDYLDYVDECRKHQYLKNNPELRVKVDKMLSDLLCEMKSSDETIDMSSKEEHSRNSELKYYIKKLLNMSRKCVENLTISSDFDSTPNVFDNELQCYHECEKSDVESVSFDHHCEEPVEHDSCVPQCVQCSREPAEIWKALLVTNTGKAEGRSWSRQNQREVDSFVEDINPVLDEGNFPKVDSDIECSDYDKIAKEKKQNEEEKESRVVTSHENLKTSNDLDLISEKCSKRISELTDLLSQVRRDKEKLLETASQESGSSSIQILKCIDETEFDALEGSVGNANNSKLRFKSHLPLTENNSAIAVVDNSSAMNGDSSFASTGTFPDVMNELLDRKIITSPFKWCEGHNFKETETVVKLPEKPSSIETVIGDFRERISKIKPFSLSSSGATRCSLSITENCKEIMQIGHQCSDVKVTNEISSREKINKSKKNMQEGSLESIDLAFKHLGLNWAKSFLKKVEDSKAMSSSSCSDEKLHQEN